jgi:hypothetical protein
MGWHTADIRKHHGHLDTHDAQENRLSLGIAVGTEAIARVLAVFNSLQELRARSNESHFYCILYPRFLKAPS